MGIEVEDKVAIKEERERNNSYLEVWKSELIDTKEDFQLHQMPVGNREEDILKSSHCTAYDTQSGLNLTNDFLSEKSGRDIDG